MKTKLVITNDGSHSIFNTEMNECYHSKHGAIVEAEHVFIKNGLLAENKKQFNIFLRFCQVLSSVFDLQSLDKLEDSGMMKMKAKSIRRVINNSIDQQTQNAKQQASQQQKQAQ